MFHDLFRLLATGYWFHGVASLRLVLVSLAISSCCGCDGMSRNSSLAPPAISTQKSTIAIKYDGGFVFADRDHIVGIDVNAWGLESISQVQRIQTSCECVHASVRELGNGGIRKTILVVDVAADAKLSRNAALAVEIQAIHGDDSMKLLSFEFTHVAMQSLNGKDQRP